MSTRKLLTLFIIPAALIFGLLIYLNNRQESSGRLILTQEQVDFGTVSEWEGAVTRPLIARNTGKVPLHIQRVQIGCSYAEIAGPTAIYPGTAARFQVTIHPELLPAAETSATAAIFTDSPITPIVYLRIVAKAKRFATLTPAACEFRNTDPEEVYRQVVALSVNAPLRTSDIRLLPSGHEAVNWEIEATAAADTFLLNIEVGPLKTEGLFASLLTLSFPNERTLTLPIIAKGNRE